MMNRAVFGVLASVALSAATVSGCSSTDERPSSESATRTTTSSAATSSERTTTTTTSEAPTPTGTPIGTATIKVSGTGQATISYQINGAAEEVERDVALPWELEYPVYDKVQSSVTADAGDAELTCSIIMDGNLVSFKTEPNPTCSFAYY